MYVIPTMPHIYGITLQNKNNVYKNIFSYLLSQHILCITHMICSWFCFVVVWRGLVIVYVTHTSFVYFSESDAITRFCGKWITLKPKQNRVPVLGPFAIMIVATPSSWITRTLQLHHNPMCIPNNCDMVQGVIALGPILRGSLSPTKCLAE